MLGQEVASISRRLTEGNAFAKFDNPRDWFYFVFCIFCVCCAALASGLTIGLLSFDNLKLQIKTENGTPSERVNAAKILPLLEKRHDLLCTLLVFNTLANEALPVFLDSLVPSYAAIVISTTFILIAGEVIPVAFFTGPDQLKIAARLIPCVKFLMFILYPIAKPMALGLDRLLGREEDDVMSRDELAVLMQITRHSSIAQYESQLKRGENVDDKVLDDVISQAEVNTISGVLTLSSKRISDMMVKWDKVFMLSSDTRLDSNTLQSMNLSGYSYIPIYRLKSKHRIIGMLNLKSIISVDSEQNTPISSLSLSPVVVVGLLDNLHTVLHKLQLANTLVAIVSEKPMVLQTSIEKQTDVSLSATPLGIISINDIYEAILNSHDDVPSNQAADLTLANTLKKVPSIVRTLTSGASGEGGIAPRTASSHGFGNKDLMTDSANPKGMVPGSLLTKYGKRATSQTPFDRTESNKSVYDEGNDESSKIGKKSLLSEATKEYSFFGFLSKNSSSNNNSSSSSSSSDYQQFFSSHGASKGAYKSPPGV